jgi:hypothetical protein
MNDFVIIDMEDYEGKEYAEMKHQFKFLVYIIA